MLVYVSYITLGYRSEWYHHCVYHPNRPRLRAHKSFPPSTMSLSQHIDPEELIEQAADHPILGLLEHPAGKHARAYHSGAHAGRYVTEPIPKYKIPQKGTDAEATYEVRRNTL